MAKELDWSLADRGQVLGAFFYGYVLSQVAGAILARKYGGHVVLGVAAFLWSLCSMAVPLLARYSFFALILGRVFLGLFEGCVFPVIYHLFASRIPENERSKSIASLSLGVFSGAIFSFVVSPILMHTVGWAYVFYFFGTAGFVWCGLWTYHFIYSGETDGEESLPCMKTSPGSHRVKSTSTMEFESLGFIRHAEIILSHKTVWAIIICHFCHNVGSFVMMAWLPTYFEDEFHLGGSSVVFTCLPYIAMAVAVTLISKYADSHITKDRDALCEIRRKSTIVGFTLAGTFMVLITTTSWAPAGILYMCIALAFNGAGPVAGYEAAKLDIADAKYVGALQSISNTIAAFAGLFGVPAVAFIKDVTGTWTAVFIFMGVMFYVAAFVFYKWAHYTGRLIE